LSSCGSTWNQEATQFHAPVKKPAKGFVVELGDAVPEVLRLLTPLKMSYEGAKKRAEPYTKIVEELPDMRRDTVDLVKKAVGEQRKAYVLVNNRSEGNAPLTIQALRKALQAADP
jgi:hypothetical protein